MPDSTSPARMLKEHGLRPLKGLGQNFLVDPGILEVIVASSELGARDTVLEIGAGLGTLSRALGEAAGKVIAVEIDQRLIPLLRQNLADLPNVKIVASDIRQFDLGQLPKGYKAVGNLPYYLTSHLLRHFLEAENKPRILVVTVQREVAERIIASPGEMSLLAVSVQFYGQPKILARLPRGAFYPPPQVTSAIVRIMLDEQAWPQVQDRRAFFALVRAGFSQKRKYLRNALAGGLDLSVEATANLLAVAGLDQKTRAQNLAVEDWVRLYLAWQNSRYQAESVGYTSPIRLSAESRGR